MRRNRLLGGYWHAVEVAQACAERVGLDEEAARFVVVVDAMVADGELETQQPGGLATLLGRPAKGLAEAVGVVYVG